MWYRRVVLRALPQVGAVRAVRIPIGQPEQLSLVDESLGVGDLLDARHFEALAQLEGLNELGCSQQRVVGAAVKPCDAASQHVNRQLAAPKVFQIDVRDFE